MADAILTAVVFSQPPGIPGAIEVEAEEGDVVLHLALGNTAFCALVLTADDALDLNLLVAARVVDLRRRQVP